MFYLPIELREPKELVTPKGPNFSKAKWASVNFGGTIVRLRLPKHKPPHSDLEQTHLKGEIKLDSKNSYMEANPTGHWQHCHALVRDWRFCGPWFTGAIARVHFALSANKCQLQDKSETLFQPSVFEREIDYLLTERYADEKFRGASDWQAPLNWQAHQNLPVFSTSYDIAKTNTGGGGDVQKRVAFPILNNCIVTLHFSHRRPWPGNMEDVNAIIDRSTMEELSWDIINSLQVELSEEAQQQLAEAQRKYPDEKLSEHRQPLKWTTPEDDELNARYKANPHLF
ncbi:hypothetical protein [Endozoicomonas arenosclerae]|uniref:hypothetical protein n=1 Tax=Endozoicomonas arenosclerae TaxID=1633495 RepID=UPI000780732A|nr:hypothetical protein [Endozoicomonas arenosclerae]